MQNVYFLSAYVIKTLQNIIRRSAILMQSPSITKNVSECHFKQEHKGFKKRSNPILPRINADNQSKSTLCIFFAIFTVISLILMPILLFFPVLTQNRSIENQLFDTNLKFCKNPYIQKSSQDIIGNQSLRCGFYDASSPNVSMVLRNMNLYNYYTTFNLKIQPTSSTENIYFSKDVVITLYQLQQIQQQTAVKFVVNKAIANNKLKFIFDTSELSTKQGYRFTYEVPLVRATNFMDSNQKKSYFLEVSFTNKQELKLIRNMTMNAETLNPTFVYIFLGLLFVFWIIMLISTISYLKNFLEIPTGKSSFQQKYLIVVGISCLLFNNPFLMLNLKVKSAFLDVYAFIAVATYVSLVLYSFLIFTAVVKFRKSLIFWRTSAAYVLLMYVFSIVLFILYRVEKGQSILEDMTKDISSQMKGMSIFLLILFLIYCLYLLFQIALKSYLIIYNSEPFWHLKIVFFYNVGIIIAIVTSLVIGQIPVEQFSEFRMVYLFILANVYTIVLQNMFKITSGGGSLYLIKSQSQKYTYSQFQNQIQAEQYTYQMQLQFEENGLDAYDTDQQQPNILYPDNKLKKSMQNNAHESQISIHKELKNLEGEGEEQRYNTQDKFINNSAHDDKNLSESCQNMYNQKVVQQDDHIQDV